MFGPGFLPVGAGLGSAAWPALPLQESEETGDFHAGERRCPGMCSLWEKWVLFLTVII